MDDGDGLATARGGGNGAGDEAAAGLASQKRLQRVMEEVLRRPEVIRGLRAELREWKNMQNIESDASDAYAEPVVEYRSGAHRFASWVTTSPRFDLSIMLVIFINAMSIAVESSQARGKDASVLQTMDAVFLTIYVAEFLIKVYVEPVGYWSSGYNRFDFVVLALSFLQYASLDGVDVTYVRVLRAFRALRALRSVSFVRQLRVLVAALVKTLASISNLLVLLVLIMFVFAVMGFYLFGPDDSAGGRALTEGEAEWATLGSAMYTLWVLTTADGWTDVQRRLDERGMGASRIFTVVYLFMGHFITTNLFIGLIIQNLDEAQTNEKLYQTARQTALASAKKGIIARIQAADIKTLNKALHQRRPDSGAHIRAVNRAMHSQRRRLRPDDMVPMNDISTNLVWLRAYLTTLDVQQGIAARCHSLHFELATTLAEQHAASLGRHGARLCD